jgi:N-acetylglucosaminyldiphosphoundecaprenol N-acetyl-beta-D-mannosaminyltransferase
VGGDELSGSVVRPDDRPGRVPVAGVGFDPLTEAAVVGYVRDALARGEGGRIVTPNVDILRLAGADPAVRGYLDDATLVLPDGTPVVWASRLSGRGRLPERVAGSSLIWPLSEVCAEDGRRVFLVGGAPGAPGIPGGAQRAAAVLGIRYRNLRVAGCASPEYGFERHPDRWAEVRADIIDAKPDLVFVGLGFPKQERLIDDLRPELPGTWFLGCGASINFVVGDQRRAPVWMQRLGVEWLHRLAQEPRRLGPRYLRHDLPYALRLLATSARGRFRR